MRRTAPRHAPSGAADWYKDAIIYEVRVRSFFDSDGDGIGDFRGLTARLDYLADLGVTALWLLPFYPSPLRDDGYDIEDYTDVDPRVGTLDDLRQLVEEVHSRGMRIITELVLNHTSDQHPWFQRARRAPAGSAERAFYVWNDDAKVYGDARIIFKDFEASNWTWDPLAKQYYWHRFYSHQPDLNFENPRVKKELLAVVDFWLGLGVDGLRLDAVPYLYEEEGTSCENLPSTHAFLRELRAHIDARFPGRMLLAEANQWPEEAAAYFGAGDECHMNFHFPLMPRMFMALHVEDRFPIVDILAQTPTPPGTCQWALFLRNHDELTLEMVTEDERNTMYRAYAAESAARINLGIRRRLAPLVENDRRKIELLSGLLLSLPGTPVLYYGDEIGMGDNMFLGDRDGVRTPMQWTMDRNAGFSTANPQKLILPVNIDSAYHYATLNVETQENNPTSLLWWTKRLLAVRRETLAFGRGTMEILHPPNPKVFAFVRRYEDEAILVVANLSRSVQFAQLDLSAFKGLRPIEIFGRAVLPNIGDDPYLLTLGAHAFYWLSLEPEVEREAEGRLSAYVPPTVEARALAELVPEQGWSPFDEILPATLGSRPWFPRRGQVAAEASTVDVVPLDDAVTVVVARVDYEDREPELVPLFLGVTSGGEQEAARPASSAQLAQLRGEHATAGTGIVFDALEVPAGAKAILRAIAERHEASGQAGRLVGRTFAAIDLAGLGEPRRVHGTRSDVLVQFDDRYLLRVLRCTEEGPLPEIEVGRYLSERGFAHAPALLGTLEYIRRDGPPSTVAVLERRVQTVETAWQRTLAELGRYYEGVLTTHRDAVPPPLASAGSPWSFAMSGVPGVVRELMGGFHESLSLLGQRTAELHAELLRCPEPAFVPEPYSIFDRRSDYQSLRNLAGEAMRGLQALSRRAGPLAKQASVLVHRWGKLLKRFEPLLSDRSPLLRMRCHGALDLEQVVVTGKDYAFVDLDRGTGRSIAERRRKRLPLRDLASLVRSLDLATDVAIVESGAVREADRATLAPWARVWSAGAASAVVSGYLRAAGESKGGDASALPGRLRLYPEAPAAMTALLDVFVLESMVRDLLLELEESRSELSFPLTELTRTLEGA